MPNYATLQELTAADVKTFDDDAKKLLAMMTMAKWRGYLSSQNHAIMHAPDGVSTIAVSRDSLRGRSGRNAKADFERWLKGQVDEITDHMEAVERLEHSPFGDLTQALTHPRVEKGGWGWRDGAPIGLRTDAAVEIKRNQEVCEWMNSRTREQRKDEGALLYDAKAPLSWAVFDTRGWPSLVGHGSGTTAEEAYANFLTLDPDAFPGQRPELTPEESTNVATMYECPDCGQTWDNRHAVAAHRAGAHSTKVWTCEVCGREFKSAGTIALHTGTHNKAPCPECGDAVVPHFLTRHLAKHENARAKAEGKGPVVQTEPRGNARPRTLCAICGEAVSQKAMVAHLATHTAQAPATVSQAPATVSPDITLTSGDSGDVLAKIRAIVAEPLVAQNLALEARVAELEAQNQRLVAEREDAKARIALILEAVQA